MTLNVELLETSFAQICEQKADFTQCFYQQLFTDFPGVKPLFAKTDMKEQPKKLFASLTLVVNNLKNPEVLTQALQNLGQNHVKYGVVPEQYDMVGQTLIKSMAITLADDWTQEFESAWLEAYQIIADIMVKAANAVPT